MKNIPTITRSDWEKPHKPVTIAGQWNKISTQSLRNTKQSANHISRHSITQLPHHYSKMRHVLVAQKRNPPYPTATKRCYVCHILPSTVISIAGKKAFSCKTTHMQSNLVNTCWWAGICLLWLTTPCVACVADATQWLLPPVPSMWTIVVGTRSLLPQIIKLNQLRLKCNQTSMMSQTLYSVAL